MSRLTTKKENGYGIVGGIGLYDVVNLLGKYEDTGFTPEEVEVMSEDLKNYELMEELRWEEEVGEDL